MRILFLLLLSGFMACSSHGNRSVEAVNKDSVTAPEPAEKHLLKTGELYKRTPEELKAFREQNRLDSLNFLNKLHRGLSIANQHKNENDFELVSDTLKIRYGYLFSRQVKHLIILRHAPYASASNIYKLENDLFKEVCSKETSPLTFMGDTICDVNGDNRPDYLFYWYPSSGCCPRDIYDVYLQKPAGNFAEEVEFINPHFSPAEKVIRGLCYGQQPVLYKFKWKEYAVDTIEYVNIYTMPDSIVRYTSEHDTVGELLKDLPEEYHKLGRSFKGFL